MILATVNMSVVLLLNKKVASSGLRCLRWSVKHITNTLLKAVKLGSRASSRSCGFFCFNRLSISWQDVVSSD